MGFQRTFTLFAKLYPECDSIKEAVNSALNLYRIVHGEGNIEIWKKNL